MSKEEAAKLRLRLGQEECDAVIQSIDARIRHNILSGKEENFIYIKIHVGSAVECIQKRMSMAGFRYRGLEFVDKVAMHAFYR